MTRSRPLLPAIALLAASCGNPTNDSDVARQADAGETVADAGPADESAPNALMPAPPPLNPPAPGEPGGLPDDRTPVSEAPFTPESAQGAANVVQTYYALIEAGKYGEAWKFWSDSGRASGMSAAEFAASFDKYGEYHANIGAPGRIEGAAGSLYVEVPVQVYGRLKSGAEFNMLGPVTLRRVNDVPGSTAEQRRWHIARTDIQPRP
jgi:hypothetical protein